MFDIIITTTSTTDHNELDKCMALSHVEQHNVIDSQTCVWTHSSLPTALHSLLILLKKNAYVGEFECPRTDDDNERDAYFTDRPGFSIELRDWDIDEDNDTDYTVQFKWVDEVADSTGLLEQMYEELGRLMDVDIEDKPADRFVVTGLSEGNAVALAKALKSALNKTVSGVKVSEM